MSGSKQMHSWNLSAALTAVSLVLVAIFPQLTWPDSPAIAQHKNAPK